MYSVAAGVAVCAGDPICSSENMPLLLAEFITYCKQNDLDICFCQTKERYIPLYIQLGFGNTKYGEEAMFDLEVYNIAGKKGAKIRNAINHATSLGITVSEYEPLKNRDKINEQQINDVSNVTRRRNDAPIGVMEKITVEAFNKMKSEGVKWGTLGLAPLANVADEGGVTENLPEFVYEKLNSFYGFKTLHHYKKKYSPTAWEPRYLVYYPKMITPKIAYSIIKAQNPKGVTDYILSQLNSIFTVKKGSEEL